MRKRPTRKEWVTLIIPEANHQSEMFLMSPNLWGEQFREGGEVMFYDEEHRDSRKRNDHLIDQFHVTRTLHDHYLHTEVTNDKHVDGYNLFELLLFGTEDYVSQENLMKYYYRYKHKWYLGYRRKGIRRVVSKRMESLIKKALYYGLTRAINKWRRRKGLPEKDYGI